MSNINYVCYKEDLNPPTAFGAPPSQWLKKEANSTRRHRHWALGPWQPPLPVWQNHLRGHHCFLVHPLEEGLKWNPEGGARNRKRNDSMRREHIFLRGLSYYTWGWNVTLNAAYDPYLWPWRRLPEFSTSGLEHAREVWFFYPQRRGSTRPSGVLGVNLVGVRRTARKGYRWTPLEWVLQTRSRKR